MTVINRELAEFLSKTVSEAPLVYLNGPRQVGKSWLVRHLDSVKPINYITFDDMLSVGAAINNPDVFVGALPKDALNILDEVQMVPTLFSAMKKAIDESRLNGIAEEQFLLTGSANIMAIPNMSQAFVGRMAILTLWQVSSAEYNRSGKNFVRSLFAENLGYKKYGPYDLVSMIGNATFPSLSVRALEAQPTLLSDQGLADKLYRTQWLSNYITTILQRDIKTVASIRKPENVFRLLSVFATQACSLLNNTSAMEEAGLNKTTYYDYKAFLQNTFLIYELQPWAKPGNVSQRYSKRSKIFFTDTNLLLYVMRRDLTDVFANDRPEMGHVFENFVATEIIKNMSIMPTVSLSHFRTNDNQEVDFVLEDRNGDTVGIEVKLNSAISGKDFNGLRTLKESVGDRFKKGIILYNGHEIMPFETDMWAVPVCYLWE